MKSNVLITISTAVLSVTAMAQTSTFTLSIDSFAAKIEKQSQPQIIDARSPEEFALNHVQGAINFNLESVDYATYIGKLDKSQPVFIYSIQTNRSGKLAADLQKKGFDQVYDLKGGIGSWVGKGKPYYTTARKGLSFTDYNNIISTYKVVLVDIGSRYCGACKKVKPILDSLRSVYSEGLKILEIELEENPQLITALQTVEAFPYIIIYRQGDIVFKRSGINGLQNDIRATLAKLQ